MTREERAKRAQSVIEFVKDGRRYEEAAELFGLSVGYVALLCYKDSVKAIQGAKEKRNVDMQSYKEQGHSMQEVADRFGVTKAVAQSVCKGIAPQTNRRPRVYRNGWNHEKSEANAIRIIEERAPSFEYVGGFTNCEGMVNIRCKVCGHAQSRSLITIRHKNIACENCKRIAAERKSEQEEQQRRLEAERKEWEKAGKRKAKQLSFAVCECCGSLFFPTTVSNNKYCSVECANKHHNSTKKDRRMRKLSTVMVDKNITLKDLFKRDGGVCAICGKRCRWDDKQELADGTIVTHKDYPSVDHIVPLSKGGKHAWDNIQLACRSCNSRKGDRF